MSDALDLALTILIWGILNGLIVYGLAIMVARLEGPFGIFGLVRSYLIDLSQSERVTSMLHSHTMWLEQGADCVFCWSPYVALIVPFLLLPISALGSFALILIYLIGIGVAYVGFNSAGYGPV